MTQYFTFQIHVRKCSQLSDQLASLLTTREDQRDNCIWVYTRSIMKMNPVSYLFSLHGRPTREGSSHMERAPPPQCTVFALALIVIYANWIARSPTQTNQTSWMLSKWPDFWVMLAWPRFSAVSWCGSAGVQCVMYMCVTRGDGGRVCEILKRSDVTGPVEVERNSDTCWRIYNRSRVCLPNRKLPVSHVAV